MRYFWLALVSAALVYSESLLASQWAETTASSLKVRSSPAGAVIGSISKSSVVKLVEIQEGWAYIKFAPKGGKPLSKDGWVSAKYLQITQPQKDNLPTDQPVRLSDKDYDSQQVLGILWVLIVSVVLLFVGLLRRNLPTSRGQTGSAGPNRSSEAPPVRSSSSTTTEDALDQSLVPVTNQPRGQLSAEAIEHLKRAEVRHVIDGDTVVIGGLFWETRIRLYGIDCPEDGQPWGDTATAGLVKLIGGKHVRLESHGEDKYNRTLGTLYVWSRRDSEWLNVNEKMVVKGHAWVMRRFYGDLSDARKKTLNDLERWAKRKRVGLWRADNPIPPWNWRSQ